jgi:hypothetical protein
MNDLIYSKLCEKVNVRYHKRIEEILKVLDSSVDYNLKHCRNPSTFRETVKSYQNNREGYVRISGSFITLHGVFRPGPDFKVLSPFIVCLVKDRLMHPTKNQSFIQHTLLIYEQVENNLVDLVRGAS